LLDTILEPVAVRTANVVVWTAVKLEGNLMVPERWNLRVVNIRDAEQIGNLTIAGVANKAFDVLGKTWPVTDTSGRGTDGPSSVGFDPETKASLVCT
jgi:hypothetical protein